MKSGDVLANKYRLVQRIGEGAMGEVWAGENQATGRKVALKLILHHLQQVRPTPKNNIVELRQRMLQEARACGKLSHRNIVQIYDVGETQTGDPFLVLELLRGRTLAERLKDTRRMDPAMAARIGADIANALSVAHTAKIIHRDLKPANIFLHQDDHDPDERFVVKVLDFGVSKSLDGSGDGPATVTNMAVGSPVYMSPEQVALRKDLDGRTDIWSLGIVLYEMLTGGRPFSGSVDDVVRQIILTRINKVALPSTKVRDVPPELDALVSHCLEYERDSRFGDAKELSKALHAISKAGLPDRGRSASRPSPIEVQQAGKEAPPATTTPLPAAVGPSQGPTGTHLLPVSMTNASPAPAWRNELAQWRAQQDVASATRAAMMEVVQGGTQALDSASILANAIKPEPTGTTSALGALAGPAIELKETPTVLRGDRFRSRSAQTKLALIGLIAFSVLVFLVLAVHAASSPDEPAPEKAKPPTATSAKTSQSSMSFMVPTSSMVQPEQAVVAEAVPEKNADKPSESVPKASAAPAITNVSAPKEAVPVPRQTGPKPAVKKMPMTTCKIGNGIKVCTKTKATSKSKPLWVLGSGYSPGKL